MIQGCMPCSSLIISEMLPEIHTMEKFDFLKSVNLCFKVADLNFGCATFCALPSFDAVTTFSSHTTFASHKVNVKGSDIDMCSATYFLFDHNTKYCTIYLCPHTVVAIV